MLKINNFFFNILPTNLLIIIPILLITGPFLSDLAITIIALVFIVNLFKNKLFKYINNIYFKIFIIFYFYLLINSLFLNYTFDSFKTSITYFRFGFFSLCVWYLIDLDKTILNKIKISFFLCFSILIIDGFIQFFTGKNIFGYEMITYPRVSSFFGDELILGSYISRLFPIFFALVIVNTEKLNSMSLYIYSLIFILAEVLVFFSGERTAFFFINFSALIIISLIKNFKKLRLFTLLISISIMIIITFFESGPKSRIIDKTLNQTYNDKGELLIFSKHHTHLYKSSFNIFKDNVMFGVGPKNYKFVCKNLKYEINPQSCSNHPHNTYLQLLSETGIIGFIFIFTLFLYLIYKCLIHFYLQFLNKKIFSDFEVCLIAAIIISIWPIIPTGDFFNNWLSIVYFLPTGMLLWSIHSQKK